MISIADTLWEVFSLVAVFLFGLLMTPRVGRWFGLPWRYAVMLYVWHSLLCMIYILYSISNGADSLAYFLKSQYWNATPLPGTQMVIAFTSLFSRDLGLSYGGVFFVYNLFGAVGLIAFSSALRSALADKSFRTRRLAMLLPFLPGLSFWSAAIGKDSIVFFGVGLLCWAAASPYRRILAVALALVAIGLVRPHIAGFLIIALAFAYTFGGGGRIAAKAVVTAILAPATFYVVTFALAYVGLEEAESASDVTGYLTQRQGYNLGGGSSVVIADYSVPVRIFTYLFRPLFFDAHTAFALVVSFENLVLFGVVGAGLLALLKRRSSLTRFQRIFFLLYVVIALGALANTTANLGIAIRQKTMFLPMLLLFVLSHFPPARARARRNAPLVPVPRPAQTPYRATAPRIQMPDSRTEFYER